jgi:hypothetical protein
VARIMRDLEFLEALDLQYLEQVEALLGKIRSKAIHLDFKLFDARRAAEKRAKNAERRAKRKLYSLDEVLSVATHPDDQRRRDSIICLSTGKRSKGTLMVHSTPYRSIRVSVFWLKKALSMRDSSTTWGRAARTRSKLSIMKSWAPLLSWTLPER